MEKNKKRRRVEDPNNKNYGIKIYHMVNLFGGNNNLKYTVQLLRYH